MNFRQRIFLLAMVVLVATLFTPQGPAIAQVRKEPQDQKLAPQRITTVIQKNQFQGLRDWVESHFADNLVPESIQEITVDEKPAIRFTMVKEGAMVRTILVDNGESLIEHSSTDESIDEKGLNDELSDLIKNQAIAALTSCDDSYRCNCVLWVRNCRVPSLPSGLTNYTGKVGIINSYTPRPGAVAIMNIYSPYGHVAYVRSVNSDGTITVEEANYVSCTVSSRRATPAAMRVVGYYTPIPPPSINYMSPSTLHWSWYDQDVWVNGSNFSRNNLRVEVRFPNGATSTLSGTQIPYSDPNWFLMKIRIGSSGWWSIKAINSDGSQSNQYWFYVY